MRHAFDVVVRWSDEDRLGHVNNSRYLTFTEDARLVWLSDSPRGNGGVILARTEIDFLRPVHFVAGGHLQVQTSVTRIGSRSIGLRQDVVDDNQESVARSQHVLVSYDYLRQRPQPWSAEERAWLSGWVSDGPAVDESP